MKALFLKYASLGDETCSTYQIGIMQHNSLMMYSKKLW